MYIIYIYIYILYIYIHIPIPIPIPMPPGGINDRRGHGVHRGIIHSPIADRLVQVEDLGEVLPVMAFVKKHQFFLKNRNNEMFLVI